MASEPVEKSLVERIRHVLHGDDEPRDVAELKSVLREAADRDIVGVDTLQMLDGVFDVAAMRVRDIMIPRAQMVVVEIDQQLDWLKTCYVFHCPAGEKHLILNP